MKPKLTSTLFNMLTVVFCSVFYFSCQDENENQKLLDSTKIVGRYAGYYEVQDPTHYDYDCRTDGYYYLDIVLEETPSGQKIMHWNLKSLLIRQDPSGFGEYEKDYSFPYNSFQLSSQTNLWTAKASNAQGTEYTYEFNENTKEVFITFKVRPDYNEPPFTYVGKLNKDISPYIVGSSTLNAVPGIYKGSFRERANGGAYSNWKDIVLPIDIKLSGNTIVGFRVPFYYQHLVPISNGFKTRECSDQPNNIAFDSTTGKLNIYITYYLFNDLLEEEYILTKQ